MFSLERFKKRASKQEIFAVTGIIARMTEKSARIIFTSEKCTNKQKRGSLSTRNFSFNELEILGNDDLSRLVAAGIDVSYIFTHRTAKQTLTHALLHSLSLSYTHTHKKKYINTLVHAIQVQQPSNCIN